VYARLLRATLDGVGEAVLVADEDGQLLLANQPFAALAGLGAEYRLELRDLSAALGALGAPIDEAGLEDLLSGAESAPKMLELADERVVMLSVATVLLDEGGSGRMIALRDVTSERRQVRELEHRALHDDLSGLPGRDLLMDRLERALTRQSREGGAVGVAFMDLNRFKEVNDRHGHAAGDRVLVEVAGRLQHELRDADTVGRLGGDEFLIICDGLDSESTLEAICERIQLRVAEPYRLGPIEINLSASLGAVLEWDVTVPVGQLIERADALMYAAKRRGSQREIFIDGRPPAATGWPTVVRRPLGAQQIRDALDRGHLYLAFLPVVALADGRTVAVEGLLRCTNSDLESATPRELMELIEQARLVERFDEWALGQAASAARALLDASAATHILSRHHEAAAPVRVVLNLSVAQLAHDAVPASTAAAASEHDIDPGLLSFDIAEAIVQEDPAWLAPTVAALRGLGCNLIVDDVAAPDIQPELVRDRGFDGLKLDRPLVGRIASDPDFAARSKVAVAAARSQRLSVTGEGVDDERRLRAVRELGCDNAQGFGFHGFPRAVTELVKVIGGTESS
jgi:diguanylate cyclase (GGDEF)-like protein